MQTEPGELETTSHRRRSHNCPRTSTTDGCSEQTKRGRNGSKLTNITGSATESVVVILNVSP